jgi:quercetin dioxygenase-like cupin family protein
MKLLRRNTAIALGLGAVVAAPIVGTALATPPSGVTNPPWSPVIGRFNDIHTTAKTDIDPGPRRDIWRAKLDVKGATDVHIVENIIAPNGTFGWHSHPGPSLVIVKSGTLSVYHPDCKPMDYGPGSPNGSTFVDGGHDVHMVRNNGTVTAEVYVVSIVPAGFERRIDEPNPNPRSCPN